MTPRILAERIIRELSGGNIPNDSPYDIDYVMLTVRDAVAEDLKVEIIKRKSGDMNDKSPISHCISIFPDIEVKRDVPTGRCYVDIPVPILSLKFNKGVHSVSENKKSLKTMIPVHNPQIADRLPHGNLEQQAYGYYIEGPKVFWMRDILQDGIKKVLLKLNTVYPPQSGPDDVLPVPPENVARILDIVKARVQNRVIQDRLVDGNPNLRNLNEQPK